MMVASLEELVGKLGQTEEKTFTDTYMANVLNEYWEQVYNTPPEHFMPGDMVIHKCPTYAAMNHPGLPALFMGYLDGKIDMVEKAQEYQHLELLTSNAMGRVLDCLILFFVPDGEKGECRTWLMDSREFKAWSPKNGGDLEGKTPANRSAA